MEMKTLWEYHLTAKALCLGERNKKGTYRSTVVSSIPYSQITGALRAAFGTKRQEGELHAVGVLKSFSQQSQVRALRDVSTGVSKLPIEADILTGVQGVVFIVNNAQMENLPLRFKVRMGAFRSYGLGVCWLERAVDSKPLPVEPAVEGNLAVRLPEDPAILPLFGVTEVLAPVWGYLFKPDIAHEGGQYVRALFEKSIVRAPSVLLE